MWLAEICLLLAFPSALVSPPESICSFVVPVTSDSLSRGGSCWSVLVSDDFGLEVVGGEGRTVCCLFTEPCGSL